MEDIPETEYPIKCIVIKDFSDNYIRYDLIHSSMVHDLMQFIKKIPILCIFQNFNLEVEKNGKKLFAEDNLFVMDLKDFDVIKMVPCLYDPSTAKEHFDSLKYLLDEHPNFVGTELIDLKKMIYKDLDKLIEESQKLYEDQKSGSLFSFFNYLVEDKEKKEETTDKVKLAEEKKKVSIDELKQKILDVEYKKFNLSNIPKSIFAENKGKPTKYRCLNTLFLSAFNCKIETNEAPKGDLLYIEVITLENVHYFITCNEKGFFLNNSKLSTFDPVQQGTYASYTLPGLLSQLSASFKENFSKTLLQNNHGDDFLFLPSPLDKYDWLLPVENPFYYEYRFKPFSQEKVETLLLNKEWNEEYQGILDIKNPENMNLETREKLLVPFYNSFKQVALEGAKLIANKKIKPFSLSEAPNSGYYIYGNIFITVLEDSNDFTIFNKTSQCQTLYGANLDLRHINFVNKVRYEYGLNDIYFGLCCIITYKGMTLHAQVMTPGIIFNSEHLIVYGEYDENKIRSNEEFKKEISPTLQKLGILENTIKTPDGLTTIENYLGHPEIKGIKGVDKRNYLFDLVHLFPRDLNFDEQTIMLRPEVLQDYKAKIFETLMQSPETKEILQKNQQEIEAISKTAKNNKDMIKQLEKPLEFKENLYKENEKIAQQKIRLNTVYKTEYDTLNPQEEDIKLLNDLAIFLKQEIKRCLSESLVEEENLPGDSESLKKHLHKYGISSKYYSELISMIDNTEEFKKLHWLKCLLQREMIVKAAKSVYNQHIKTFPLSSYQAFTAYFLNCLLGHTNQIKALEFFNTVILNNSLKFSKPEQISRCDSEENTKKTTSKEKDKKKRRHQKKKKNKDQEINLDLKYFLTENLTGSSISTLIEQSTSDSYLIKPSELWNAIVKICKSKFDFEFKSNNNFFDLIDCSFNKLGMLKDFCKKVGLSIEAADYQIPIDFTYSKNELNSSQLPFLAENIIDFYPIIKEYSLPSEVLKPALADADGLFGNGHFLAASEKYKQVVVLSHEINGPIHGISAYCHKKLAHLAYFDHNFQAAISYVSKAIIIYEKLSEFDSIGLGACYTELGSYYQEVGDLYNAFKAAYKAWEIANLVYPKNVSIYKFYF